MLERKVVRFTQRGMQEVDLANGKAIQLTHSGEGRFRPEGAGRFVHGKTAAQQTRRALAGGLRQRRLPGEGRKTPAEEAGTGAAPARPERLLPVMWKAQGRMGRRKPDAGKAALQGDTPREQDPVSKEKQRAAVRKSAARKRYAVRMRRNAAGPETPAGSGYRAGPEERWQQRGYGANAAETGQVPLDGAAAEQEGRPPGPGAAGIAGRMALDTVLAASGAAEAGQEDENAGLAAVRGIQSQASYTARLLFPRRVPGRGKEGAKRAAAKRAARKQAQRESAQAAQKIGKAAAKPAKSLVALPHGILAAGVLMVVILALLVMSLLSGLVGGSVAGSVTEQPELEAYVAQLDAAFTAEVQDYTSFWLDAGRPVRREGENPSTNPYALAVLITGDWTDLVWDSATKTELTRLHSLLYEWETDSEVIEVDDGGGAHHEIVRIVRVISRAPEEILAEAGYTTAEEQERIRDLLAALYEIQAAVDASGGAGTIYPTEGEYAWPVPGHTYLSSYWGDGRNHKGIDIAGAGIDGEPVVAMAGGRVTRAAGGYGVGYPGCGDGGGYGNHVYLDHGGGLTSRYGHMSRIVVDVGDEVQKGQVIGYVGSSGDSSGPHLHFEIRENGVAKDPLNWYREDGSND